MAAQDYKAVLEDCWERKLLPEQTLRDMVFDAMTLISEEPTVIQLSSTGALNVIGDLHGQFYDVRYMFDVG